MPRTLPHWSSLLRSTAAPSLPPDFLALHESPDTDRAQHFINTLTDDAGHRRDCDRPFLHALLDLPAPNTPPAPSHLALAWWACHYAPARDALGIDWHAHGPLLPHLAEQGIETWTETELGAMHALARGPTHTRDAAAAARVFRAATWMLDNLQPDNATNHPWAIHLFIAMSLDLARTAHERAAADLYAQSLLHNAVVHQGKPDRFSALILWDAALSLPSEGRAGEGLATM